MQPANFEWKMCRIFSELNGTLLRFLRWILKELEQTYGPKVWKCCLVHFEYERVKRSWQNYATFLFVLCIGLHDDNHARGNMHQYNWGWMKRKPIAKFLIAEDIQGRKTNTLPIHNTLCTKYNIINNLLFSSPWGIKSKWVSQTAYCARNTLNRMGIK